MIEQQNENKKYLTIHGHFYQPPRENPWLEEIELQESALPNHDWNEKISAQCYGPNGSSRLVDGNNSIIEISNNYQYMSFNFGPTLLSWMEKYAPDAYNRIIQADINSRALYNGHGCAIAQVYNHIIMPLANQNDKITQTIWGLKDFQKRFGRDSEGIWLAEAAVDAQTLEVLIDLGVKYTILSPYQAKCVNKIGEKNWKDVSWGTIDPSQPYRYFVEGTNKQKYIDLFFYDGSISKSVAFDNLLQDGVKFAYRLNEGYVESRNRTQIVNIATDGESYGHHSKFGDMALAYVLKVGAKSLGFEITNYAQYLEMYPPTYEVDIKPVSAWSCAHGVGRWMDDCGCSTGAQPHWNQKWRKPLRQALDYLRDELIKLCSIEGTKYYKDFWQARNSYIDVILDRSEENIKEFFKEHANKELDEKEITLALKLMEIQRFSQLMYTSCGWFFADISGIETTQILKYAARAMELAQDFTDKDFETPFLSILQKAKSNIASFGSGKDIYYKWVKPSSIGFTQIAAQYAIETSLSEENNNNNEIDKLYCFSIKKENFKKHTGVNGVLYSGSVEIKSDITLEKKKMCFVALQTHSADFYCAAKEMGKYEEFLLEQHNILKAFIKDNPLNTLQTIENYYGSKFYSFKDIPMDRRKTVLENTITSKLDKASKAYKSMYEELLTPISCLNDLGMDIPESFRVCAKYTLLDDMFEVLANTTNRKDKQKIDKLLNIKQSTNKFNIDLNTPKICNMLSGRLLKLLGSLKKKKNLDTTDELLYFFEFIELLEIKVEISQSQNVFYDMFCADFENLYNELSNSLDAQELRKLLLAFLEIGVKLNINVDFYKNKIDSLTGKVF